MDFTTNIGDLVIIPHHQTSDRNIPLIEYTMFFLTRVQLLIFTCVLSAYLTSTSLGIEISVADYGAAPDDGKDDTLAIQDAIDACRQAQNARLVFSRGTYDFFPTAAKEAYFFISNNDEGLKHIAFLLSGFNGLTIDGGGSEFLFHGYVNPFIIDQCQNIVLENFSIDFKRPFHSEGVIIAYDDDGIEVEIREGFPFKVHRGTLLFTDARDPTVPLTSVTKELVYGSSHILEYDTKKRETAFMVRDYYFSAVNGYPAKKLGGRRVRIRVPGLEGTPGNTLVFGPNHRQCPAITISDSNTILCREVTINHAGGMGVIAQRSRDVTVDHCRVTPSGKRMISVTADATHFVNCTGSIVLSDNLFENQKDDATNIHGIYAQVIEQLASDELVVRLMHRQQHGFDFLASGKQIDFVRAKSMTTYATEQVARVSRMNSELTRIWIKGGVPEHLRIGDTIAEVREYPEVVIRNNTIRNNRARGMLLNCRGPVLVENNYFHTPGAAILFEGDAFHWFEQGGVRDCKIQGNTFDNCLFGVWGKAIIDVKAGIREEKETSRYNKNITITENRFRVFGRTPLLNAYCVDGLVWRDNVVELTDKYPAPKKNGPLFLVEHCDNVVIDEREPLAEKR